MSMLDKAFDEFLCVWLINSTIFALWPVGANVLLIFVTIYKNLKIIHWDFYNDSSKKSFLYFPQLGCPSVLSQIIILKLVLSERRQTYK